MVVDGVVVVFFFLEMAVVSKNRGILPPKMDGENKGNPYEQMDDLGFFPLFLETPKWCGKFCAAINNIPPFGAGIA